MDFHSLARKELQALCKKNKIPANLSNVAMADALSNLEVVDGLDELATQTDTASLKTPGKPGLASCVTRNSTARRTAKEEPESGRPTTRTLRGKKDVTETPAPSVTAKRAPVARSTQVKAGTSQLKEKSKVTVATVYSTRTRRSTRLVEKKVSEVNIDTKEDLCGPEDTEELQRGFSENMEKSCDAIEENNEMPDETEAPKQEIGEQLESTNSMEEELQRGFSANMENSFDEDKVVPDETEAPKQEICEHEDAETVLDQNLDDSLTNEEDMELNNEDAGDAGTDQKTDESETIIETIVEHEGGQLVSDQQMIDSFSNEKELGDCILDEALDAVTEKTICTDETYGLKEATEEDDAMLETEEVEQVQMNVMLPSVESTEEVTDSVSKNGAEIPHEREGIEKTNELLLSSAMPEEVIVCHPVVAENEESSDEGENIEEEAAVDLQSESSKSSPTKSGSVDQDHPAVAENEESPNEMGNVKEEASDGLQSASVIPEDVIYQSGSVAFQASPLSDPIVLNLETVKVSDTAVAENDESPHDQGQDLKEAAIQAMDEATNDLQSGSAIAEEVSYSSSKTSGPVAFHERLLSDNKENNIDALAQKFQMVNVTNPADIGTPLEKKSLNMLKKMFKQRVQQAAEKKQALGTTVDNMES